MWQVLAVVGASASLQEDAHSLEVATAALRALAPAWASAGRPPSALASTVIQSASQLPPRRMVALLSALLQALPPVGPPPR